MKEHDKRILYYFLLVFVLYASWFLVMTVMDYWSIVIKYWPATVTMIFGSFVAGSTAEGGAFVAFPVLTKVLGLSSQQSSTFGLLIQSIGMSFAAFCILLYRIPVLYSVIAPTLLGGILGILVSIHYFPIPDPYPKVLFTTMVTGFGVILIVNRWVMNWRTTETMAHLNNSKKLFFVLLGIIGGFVSGKVGCGINIITFIVLTCAFGINEKIAITTSIILMALVSITGFITHGLNNSIGEIYFYWLAAVPVVCLGAPLGAYFASKISRDQAIYYLLTLIGIELVTTIVLVPLTQSILQFCLLLAIVILIAFMGMIKYRKIILTKEIDR